ncbi:DNA-binding PadR family transcriptional regulator [Actinoplanes octamycinicus]|uniref:DNA-binding PadR family transcriptional regulator n=1 Tax=Actinoplanes octamycinicus TaxID=135948 RepID=A0A7W7H6Z1_9ACTN|nr:PadR family transcriptional regulator [Actinoplanes octamycinicus]MBB4745004.1 DNA-binding PadR family transcriptional regulator [Actinoplanes octamycinicus]GIE55591.1 PadR family transcriptional regulator [Actinoplanes octamycinicus]
MFLDILILSHLRGGPIHGYELKRKVADTIAVALNNNTLYPALRRFEAAGAVTKVAEQQTGRPPRHVYEITDVGRELLHDMVAELPAELAGEEAEFLTRLGMFDELTPDERAAVLAARDQALARRLEHLGGQAARARNSRNNRDWGGLVTAELIARTERERTWLDELRRRSS